MEGDASTPTKSSKRSGGSGVGGRGRGRSGGEGGDDDETASEYENQRLSRIRENQARLEALGLPNLASSLLGPTGKQNQPKEERRKGKKKKNRKEDADDVDNDEEYRPSYEEDKGGSSSSDEYEDDEEEDGLGSSSRSKQKGKTKKSSIAAIVGKKSSTQRCMIKSDVMDDDVALQQAIALSLEESVEGSSVKPSGLSQNSTRNFVNINVHGKVGTSIPETPGRGKKRKGNVRRMQMSQDEVIAYFFSFDEVGKGSISLRDLQKMVVSHDFTWTDKEMADMIYLFDSDGDGKLSLEDFKTILSRCHMLQESDC